MNERMVYTNMEAKSERAKSSRMTKSDVQGVLGRGWNERKDEFTKCAKWPKVGESGGSIPSLVLYAKRQQDQEKKRINYYCGHFSILIRQCVIYLQSIKLKNKFPIP